jgi:hypothetical protein
MGDWNVFFATSAGSAATLVGLLFVATQLHLGVFADPKNRWAALAQSTLTILSVNFALSLFFLMPILGRRFGARSLCWLSQSRSGEASGSGGLLSGSQNPAGATGSRRATEWFQRFPKAWLPGWHRQAGQDKGD